MEPDAAARRAADAAADIDAVNMVDFAVVFATAAGDMAADAEAVVASRRFGRVDQPDMAAAAAAAAAPPRRRR